MTTEQIIHEAIKSARYFGASWDSVIRALENALSIARAHHPSSDR
jgi:hypothetical protein